MRRHLAIAGVVVALLALVAVAAAAPKASTRYKGNTSQGLTAGLRTNASANGLTRFTIRRRFKCGTETIVGTFRTFREDGGVIPVKADGRFFAYSKLNSGGGIKSGVFSIRGKFGPNGGAARGTYRERVRLASGKRCDTGEIRYRVKAQG